MFPWIIIPIAGLFLLGSKKSSKYSKSSNSVSNSKTTGIILTSSKIEIVDKNKAIEYITNQIELYQEECKVAKFDDIKMLPLFKYIVKKLNPSFFNLIDKSAKKQNGAKLTQKQKVIAALMFTFIFTTLRRFIENIEAFDNCFNKMELPRAMNYFGISTTDDVDIEKITDQFELSYTYP